MPDAQRFSVGADVCVVEECGGCTVYGGPTNCLLERMATSDAQDENIRRAHGIPYTADYRNAEELCRFGCGTTYHDIVATKMSHCPSEERVG